MLILVIRVFVVFSYSPAVRLASRISWSMVSVRLWGSFAIMTQLAARWRSAPFCRTVSSMAMVSLALRARFCCWRVLLHSAI